MKKTLVDLHSSEVFESWTDKTDGAVTLHLIDRWVSITLSKEDFDKFCKDVMATKKKLKEIVN